MDDAVNTPPRDEAHIKPFRFWVQHILPLAYDDSLSYLEVLYKVKIKLNEVVEWANNYQDELYNYVDQKTAENLASLQDTLNQFQNNVNSQLSAQDSKINNLSGQINGILDTVNGLINQFQTDVNNQLTLFELQYKGDIRDFQNQVNNQLLSNEAWVKAQILVLQNQLLSTSQALEALVKQNLIDANNYTDEQIQKIKDSIGDWEIGNIIYPGDLQEVSVQTAIDRLWYDLRYGALTAEEYDNLNLTAQQYDNKNLTAYQYDVWARFYLTNFGNGGGDGIPSNGSALQWIKISGENYAALTESQIMNGKAYLVDGNIPTGDLPWRFVTQTEYNNLTEEQKMMDIGYIVTGG